MANQFVQVPPNSTGLKMQTFENTVGANTVESEAVTLVRSSDNTEIGTAAQPARIDPTGTTTQPISGTVAISGTIPENITQWGSTVVTAPPASGVPAVGTEVAPVIKTIERRSTDLISTATILASATFTSAWFDTQQTGASQAVLSVLIPSSGFAGNALRFDTTDDTTQVNFVTQTFTPTTGIYGSFWVPIQGRYWRVRFANGATQQTAPIIAVTTQAFPKTLNPAMGGNTNDGLLELLSSASISDTANAGFWSGTNGGAGMAALSAQYAITSGPATGGNWAALRTPTTFKTVSATATGNTALWTPTAGKKFRLMRYIIEVTSNTSLAAAAVLTISMQDSAADIAQTHSVFIPTTAITTGGAPFLVTGWVDLGNGILSAAANNVLNVNLSAALVAAGGVVRVTCCGTEE